MMPIDPDPLREDHRAMADSLVIRGEVEGDIERLRVFHRECFGRELDQGRRRWLLRESPGGQARAYVAEDTVRGQIVATYALLPIEVRLNHEAVPAALAVGAAVHPGYRRQGLFTRMGGSALERERELGTVLSLGKPNKSAMAGHLRVGWQVLCELPKLVKTSPGERPHRCEIVPEFDRRIDALIEGIADRFSFMVQRNARSLNWRLACPGREYTRLLYSREGIAAGYAVLKRYQSPRGTIGHILDLQALDDEAASQLLAAAESRAAGCSELDLWTNSRDSFAHVLQARGFIRRDDGDRLIRHTAAALPGPGAWWFSYADNDIH